MLAMVINRYGAAEDVLQAKEIAKPTIKADEVLVRLKASSINPIEYKMRTGYGRKMFTKKRGFEFPLVLGNDVCGVVEAVGNKVIEFRPGDAVFSAPEVDGQGSYAQYRAIKARYCVEKPSNLSYQEAASIPYAALTAWAALVGKAKLGPDNSSGKRVLVHGASGGIGSFAIQLLKAWGAEVTATCSTEKVERVRQLGADQVIDYKTQDFSQRLENFDLVLDTVGGDNEEKSLQVLKKGALVQKGVTAQKGAAAQYVTLVVPVLGAIDKHGFLRGGFYAIRELLRKKKACKKQNIQYHWGLFKSDRDALIAVKHLIEQGNIKPQLDRSFPLEQIALAHDYAESGKAFGKVGIDIS